MCALAFVDEPFSDYILSFYSLLKTSSCQNSYVSYINIQYFFISMTIFYIIII